MSRDYEQSMQDLAEGHRDVVGEEMDVYFVPDPERKVIRLLEVSDGFVQSGEVWPLTFRADEDFPFLVTVIQLTKAEYERTQDSYERDMKLPDDFIQHEKLELAR